MLAYNARSATSLPTLLHFALLPHARGGAPHSPAKANLVKLSDALIFWENKTKRGVSLSTILFQSAPCWGQPPSGALLPTILFPERSGKARPVRVEALERSWELARVPPPLPAQSNPCSKSHYNHRGFSVGFFGRVIIPPKLACEKPLSNIEDFWQHHHVTKRTPNRGRPVLLSSLEIQFCQIK